MIRVLGLVTIACVGEVGVCKIYAYDGSIRMFSMKTLGLDYVEFDVILLLG